MSLSWNAKKVAGFKQTAKAEPVLTETIIMLTMLVGMRSISEKNWPEFTARVAYYEQLFGTFLRVSGGKNRYITQADVRRFIGLETNATNMTTRQFVAHMGANYMREQTQAVIRSASKAKAEEVA